MNVIPIMYLGHSLILQQVLVMLFIVYSINLKLQYFLLIAIVKTGYLSGAVRDPGAHCLKTPDLIVLFGVIAAFKVHHVFGVRNSS